MTLLCIPIRCCGITVPLHIDAPDGADPDDRGAWLDLEVEFVAKREIGEWLDEWPQRGGEHGSYEWYITWLEWCHDLDLAVEEIERRAPWRTLEAWLESEQIIKTCSCCGSDHSRNTWAELPRIGIMRGAGDEGEDLDLRNCYCGSTLAVSVGAGSSSSRLDPSGGQKEGEK